MLKYSAEPAPDLPKARAAYLVARDAQRAAAAVKKKADDDLLDAASRYRAAMRGVPADER